MVGLVI